jgi:hypothetical protein
MVRAQVYHNGAVRGTSKNQAMVEGWRVKTYTARAAMAQPTPSPTHSMFSEDWLARAQAAVNADAELALIGAWFTTAFSLTCGDRRVIMRFDHGRLVDAVSAPRLDVRCAFGFRASLEIWSRFFAEDPEPLYHDFFAMLMRVPGFVLEGDTLVAMQNARALHRAMNVMRTVRP